MGHDSNLEQEALHLTALFLLGFLGSGHCVGMCGPLILAFPARTGGLPGQLAYHLGRVTTYTLVGALLGGLGAGLAGGLGGLDTEASLAWTARIQVGFSLVAALFLCLFGLTKLGLLREPELLSLANPSRIPGFRNLSRRLALGPSPGPEDRSHPHAQSRQGPFSLFLLGLLLGLLPCGLSFAAFARSLSASGPVQGGLMTLVFGLGTLPALLLLGVTASRLTATHRRVSDLIAGMLMIGMSASLLLDLF